MLRTNHEHAFHGGIAGSSMACDFCSSFNPAGHCLPDALQVSATFGHSGNHHIPGKANIFSSIHICHLLNLDEIAMVRCLIVFFDLSTILMHEEADGDDMLMGMMLICKPCEEGFVHGI